MYVCVVCVCVCVCVLCMYVAALTLNMGAQWIKVVVVTPVYPLNSTLDRPQTRSVTVWRREKPVAFDGIRCFHCFLFFTYLFHVIPFESFDEISRKPSILLYFFSLCAVSSMNNVIVRISEMDMIVTPLNIQLWNWRALFLIQKQFWWFSAFEE
jgi:hypothetical protein